MTQLLCRGQGNFFWFMRSDIRIWHAALLLKKKKKDSALTAHSIHRLWAKRFCFLVLTHSILSRVKGYFQALDPYKTLKQGLSCAWMWYIAVNFIPRSTVIPSSSITRVRWEGHQPQVPAKGTGIVPCPAVHLEEGRDEMTPPWKLCHGRHSSAPEGGGRMGQGCRLESPCLCLSLSCSSPSAVPQEERTLVGKTPLLACSLLPPISSGQHKSPLTPDAERACYASAIEINLALPFVAIYYMYTLAVMWKAQSPLCLIPYKHITKENGSYP